MRKTIAFAFALTGLFISIYLLWVYAAPNHPMVCLGTGCDEVRASQYAQFFGIPTPAFGVVFYAALAALMFAEATGRKLHRVVLALAIIGFVVAAMLTVIEGFVIHAWCAWCVGQAVSITLVLVLYATSPAVARPQPGMPSRYWSVLMVAIMAGSVAFYLLSRAEHKKLQAAPPPSTETMAARLIRPDSHVGGDTQSPVSFVEFGDFECPSCVASYPIVRNLRAQYGDRVKFVFREYPLETIHPYALHAAEAAECAGRQGKFWEMVDRLYDAKGDLIDPSLQRYASELNLNPAEFTQCLTSQATLPQIRQDQQDGLALGVKGTPTFFVGQRRIEGALKELQFATMLLDDLQAAGMLNSSGTSAAPAAPSKPADTPSKAGLNDSADKKAAANSGTPLSLNAGSTTGGFLNVQGSSINCDPNEPKGPEPPLIHFADAQKRFGEHAVFVDVRSADDFAKSHIRGAVNVPLLEVERRAGELPKDKPIVVYEAGTAAAGDVCAAAKAAARVLISRGDKAVVYQDGLKDWEKNGGAVEK